MRCHYTVQTKQFCHKNKLPHSLRASASLCSRKSLVQCASKAVRLFSNFPCVRKCCENYDFCLCINSAWPHEDCKKFSYQILIALQIAIFFFFFLTHKSLESSPQMDVTAFVSFIYCLIRNISAGLKVLDNLYLTET